jgi:hypothetical protein
MANITTAVVHPIVFSQEQKICYSELLRFTEGNAERAQPIFISSPLIPYLTYNRI